jgi:AcrR family transcriptional regulator
MSGEDRRERRRAKKRQSIKLAAVRLILDKGLDAFTVEAISEAADISTRTFFNYFSTKEEVLLIMEPSWSAEVLLALFDARPADEPAVRSMRVVVQEIADSFVPAPEDAELWRELWTRHPDLLSRAQPDGEEEIFRVLFLAAAKKTGVDPWQDVYPTVLVTTAFSIIQWAVRFSWVRTDGKSVNELIDEAFDLLESGFKH